MESNLPASSNLELLLWLLGRRKRFRVSGDSMLPLLHPQEVILVDRSIYKSSSPQIGDIVVAIYPGRSNFKIIKRIVAVEGERYILQGDNLQASTDSRTFGSINQQQIWGKVTSKLYEH
jgi:nickel-type superoxide dismutase maturation protease